MRAFSRTCWRSGTSSNGRPRQQLRTFEAITYIFLDAPFLGLTSARIRTRTRNFSAIAIISFTPTPSSYRHIDRISPPPYLFLIYRIYNPAVPLSHLAVPYRAALGLVDAFHPSHHPFHFIPSSYNLCTYIYWITVFEVLYQLFNTPHPLQLAPCCGAAQPSPARRE